MKKGEATRHAILQKAQELIYARGYGATSVDDILKSIPITKGSFYHHFTSKDEMGLALVAEQLQPGMHAMFTDMLQDTVQPVKTITGMMRALLFNVPELQSKYGCPIGNLTDELAANHPEFKVMLAKMMATSITLLSRYLDKAIASGVLRHDIEVKSVSQYIVSGYWGTRTLGKLGRTRAVYNAYLQQLEQYMKSLQPIAEK